MKAKVKVMSRKIPAVLSLVSAVLLSLTVAFPAVAQERVMTRVNLSSQPAGALVFVDGVNRGPSPLMLFDLEPGRHHVKFRLNGYVDADDFINTNEGPSIDKSVILEEEKGLLLLKTDPEGCHIKIDGVSAGVTPRFIGTLTAKDTHTVKLSKPGYREQTITVKFNGREPLIREEKLMLDSGVVNLITDPSGAEVMVNGIVRGTTPLLVRDIPKGTATVKFKLDGFKDEVRELRMNAGEQQTLSITLEGLPGTLHLLSTPASASFYVNDEARGRGPLTIPGLKPGDYTVRCEADGFATMTRVITIGNGASVREEFRLSNMMGKIDVRTVPAGAEICLDGRRVGVTKSSGGDDSEPSDLFTIDNVMEGEHTVTIRRDGFLEAVRTTQVAAKETAHLNRVSLKRAFIPNIEVTTVNGVFRGVYKSQNEATIVIETKPGTDYPIPRQFVRKVEYLTK